ncbi:MAG TPA: hypothetical protein VEF89_15225 [Solirubrobacteraceae bacterium]|nr:hypothetical protein [Solirubrobacteraceae bacterium]
MPAQHRIAGLPISNARVRFSFLFLFLGAMPCTDWPDDVIGRDDDGFVLTGSSIGADNLLQTTVPGVFADGGVRSCSTKRCATAVGKGAWAVQTRPRPPRGMLTIP